MWLNLAHIANMLSEEATNFAGVPLSLAFNFCLSLLRLQFRVDTEEFYNESAPGAEPKQIAFKALNRICLAMLESKDVLFSHF